MAVAGVEKVEILTLADQKMEVLAALQESGLVHLEESRLEDVVPFSLPPGTEDLEVLLGRLRHALDVLSEWEERGAIDRFLGQRPALDPLRRADALVFDYHAALKKLEMLEARKHELLTEARGLEKDAEFLIPLQSLEAPLDSLRPTDFVDVRLAKASVDDLETLCGLAADRDFHVEEAAREGRNAWLIIFFLLREAEGWEKTFKGLRVIFPSLEAYQKAARPGERIRDLIKRMDVRREKIRAALASLEEEMKALAANREKLMAVHDTLLNDHGKASAVRFLGGTDQAASLEGWIPVADKERLLQSLEPFTEAAQIYFRPALPEEDPPVVLENPRMAKPFEIITGLYGLPERGIIDPTLPLAPFFFVFVGLCVSEAGYGALVALLSLLYLKLAKPRGGAKLFARLALFLGVSNIVFGTLFGAWFGFPLKSLLLIDPLKDPVKFLILSLVLGFIQVLFGILLSLLAAARAKDWQAAATKAGWLLLLPSLAALGLTGLPVFTITALAGAAGVVLFSSPSRNPLARFFGGLYGLYGISGFISDTLSYSRLLALGLSTGVIAMVVNSLSQTAFRIPWVGWLFGGLIFVGGHLFNLGIGFLGGIVHSMRLQFVEFFTKFYRAGGKAFKPFRLESRYVDFTDDRQAT